MPLRYAAAAFLLIAVLALSSILFYNPSIVNPDNKLAFKPDDPAIVRLGKNLYAENCASCHGQNLEGQPDWQQPNEDGRMPAPPHDKTGHTWHHANNLLFELTKYGVKKFAGPDYQSDMPAYENILNDEEIVAILSFIINSWPQEIRANHDRLNAAIANK